jgi:S-adenosyl-L-methionine hydrolase (adenosine-forming)
LTDFGLIDGYNGVMKGVIWGIAPDTQIADISHSIHAQNIMEGALALSRSAPYFPLGTVHVAVVDPGVGTKRRPIAAHLGAHFFVGPDNGLCTFLQERAEKNAALIEIVHLDQPRYWLADVSNVFHGRDIFSPVAAHIVNGVPLASLGSPIHDPVRLKIPVPARTARGWLGQVIQIDHFGNLATNLTQSQMKEIRNIKVEIAGHTIIGLVPTFGSCPPGDLIALYGTQDDLIISVVNGNAQQLLRVGLGAAVEVVE